MKTPRKHAPATYDDLFVLGGVVRRLFPVPPAVLTKLVSEGTVRSIKRSAESEPRFRLTHLAAEVNHVLEKSPDAMQPRIGTVQVTERLMITPDEVDRLQEERLLPAKIGTWNEYPAEWVEFWRDVLFSQDPEAAPLKAAFAEAIKPKPAKLEFDGDTTAEQPPVAEPIPTVAPITNRGPAPKLPAGQRPAPPPKDHPGTAQTG